MDEQPEIVQVKVGRLFTAYINVANYYRRYLKGLKNVSSKTQVY
ncbi:hypothetical protein [Lactiplantibacillus plantarum]|nr:hypothetical protein [Lactiplantibacillus plantarum]